MAASGIERFSPLAQSFGVQYTSVILILFAFVLFAVSNAEYGPPAGEAQAMSLAEEISQLSIDDFFAEREIRSSALDGLIFALRSHDIRAKFTLYYQLTPLETQTKAQALLQELERNGVPSEALSFSLRRGEEEGRLEILLERTEMKS